MSVSAPGQKPIKPYGMDTSQNITFGSGVKLANQYKTMNIFQRILHHGDTVAVYIPGEDGQSSKVLFNMKEARENLSLGTQKLTKEQMRFLLGTMYAESSKAPTAAFPKDRITELVRQAKTHGTSRLGALSSESPIASDTIIDMTQKDVQAFYSAIEKCVGNKEKEKAREAIEGEGSGVKKWDHPSKSHAGEKIFAPTMAQLKKSLGDSEVDADKVKRSTLTQEEKNALLAVLGEKSLEEDICEVLDNDSPASSPDSPAPPPDSPPTPLPAVPLSNPWEGIALQESSTVKIRSGGSEKPATWNDMTGLLDVPLAQAAAIDIPGITAQRLQSDADKGDMALQIVRYYKKTEGPSRNGIQQITDPTVRATLITTLKGLLVCVPEDQRDQPWLTRLLTDMQQASSS